MLFRKDPCGIICIALTYAMLLHCLYVFLFVIIIPLLNERLSISKDRTDRLHLFFVHLNLVYMEH